MSDAHPVNAVCASMHSAIILAMKILQHKWNCFYLEIARLHNSLTHTVERNYFASEHGKGPSDAETARISMYLHSAIKSRRAVLHDAKSLTYNFQFY